MRHFVFFFTHKTAAINTLGVVGFTTGHKFPNHNEVLDFIVGQFDDIRNPEDLCITGWQEMSPADYENFVGREVTEPTEGFEDDN